MILTPLNIQLAIIKAFYALAKKSVKYYTGLALGKNNTCLFKEIRLLRAYIDILRNFEIVGNKTTCCCGISGDYTLLFNNSEPENISQLQLACDNTGTIIYNEDTYNITYFYDPDNQQLILTTNIQVERTYFSSGANSAFPNNRFSYDGVSLFFTADFLSLQDFVNLLNSNLGSSGWFFEVLENGQTNVTLNGLAIPLVGLLERDDSAFYNLTDVSDLIITFSNVSFDENCNVIVTSETPNITTEILTTDNPCTPTTIEQTCLTNSQVIKIIEHINKLVR